MTILTLGLPTVSVPAGEPVDYGRDIKPLLVAKCSACHGAFKQKSGLRLDAAQLIRRGADRGPVIVSGSPAESLLFQRVSAIDVENRMPPEGEGEALNEKQLALIAAWIEGGAHAPDKEDVPQDPRRHWAYQPPVRPDVPKIDDAFRVRHPIDAFLVAEHERRGLVRTQPPGKRVLLRRLFLDLTGLPPTPEDVDAFLAEDFPDSWERSVDRLLASPRYGERWGRHWMDVWRYSDWYGFGEDVRSSRPHIWRWRDWIVESLNLDKGYDRMVTEMLAGDEVAPKNFDTLRATGFLARNWFRYNRDTWLESTVEHTAKAFLGATFNCARCHDHKFDPLTMKDYYRLRAFFEPHDIREDRVPGEPFAVRVQKRPLALPIFNSALVRSYDAYPNRPTYLYVRGNQHQPVKDEPLDPAMPAWLGGDLGIEPVRLPPETYYPGLQRFVQEGKLAKVTANVVRAREALKEARDDRTEKRLVAAEAELASLGARIAADNAKYGRCADADVDELARAAHRAERLATVRRLEDRVAEEEERLQTARDAVKPDEAKTRRAVEKAEKAVAKKQQELEKSRAELDEQGTEYQPLGEVHTSTSTGRRLSLARWITASRNPLTARVAVNHMWRLHFNAPLVPNVFDFGLRSPRPRFHEILDWLAVELVESSWSMKRLHRLIVTSDAYRMSSSTSVECESNLATDPDNLSLWRMNVRRMEAESVRDCVLHVAGSLDTEMGGPEIDEGEGQTSSRRSIYFRHSHKRQMEFLRIFDSANATGCYRRNHSVVPQQALALSNSRLAWEQAKRLARRLAGPDGVVDEVFIDAAFRSIVCRPAKPSELEECLRYLGIHGALLTDPESLEYFPGGPSPEGVRLSSDPRQRGRENLVLVLLNHNDFVTVR